MKNESKSNWVDYLHTKQLENVSETKAIFQNHYGRMKEWNIYLLNNTLPHKSQKSCQ